MSFSAKISSFGTRAANRVQQVRRGTTIKLLSAVIRDTPVDTGRLRANWQLSIGQPAEGTVEADAPGKTGLDIDEAKRIEATDGDTPVFLTNNLPYAAPIEFDGHSKDHPEGMVRKNVARFARIIQVEINNKTK